MVDTSSALTAIAMMAGIVYLTRMGGYFVGLQLRHIKGIQPVLEALPGCAFMAILAPAVRQGSVSEIVAMVCVVAIMWRSNNVVLATGTGMAVLLFGGPYLDGSSRYSAALSATGDGDETPHHKITKAGKRHETGKQPEGDLDAGLPDRVSQIGHFARYRTDWQSAHSRRHRAQSRFAG